jgi:MoxR-like ATPase
VKYLAPFVLGHRIALTHDAKLNGKTQKQVIEQVLAGIAVPVGE